MGLPARARPAFYSGALVTGPGGGRVRYREPVARDARQPRRKGAKPGRTRGGACECAAHIREMPYVARILSGEAEAD